MKILSRLLCNTHCYNYTFSHLTLFVLCCASFIYVKEDKGNKIFHGSTKLLESSLLIREMAVGPYVVHDAEI